MLVFELAHKGDLKTLLNTLKSEYVSKIECTVFIASFHFVM